MSYILRPAEDFDFEFAFEAKRLALGPYVAERWGWDDQLQREIHSRRWRERLWFVIEHKGERAGTVAIEEETGHMQFGEFYLLPAFQRQGIGTQVLLSALASADAQAIPVRLEHLKWNPVGTLYRRHGFEIVSETDSHYYLERPPQNLPSA